MSLVLSHSPSFSEQRNETSQALNNREFEDGSDKNGHNTDSCSVVEYCERRFANMMLQEKAETPHFKSKKAEKQWRIAQECAILKEKEKTMANYTQILIDWCTQHWPKELRNKALDLDEEYVESVYRSITILARKFLKSKPPFGRLGGPGVIVIVDSYSAFEDTTGGNRSILCLCEAKNLPPRYWFELMDPANTNRPEDYNTQVHQNLEIITEIVLPGSILVARKDAYFCSYFHVLALNHLYPVIVSVDALAHHNTQDRDIFNNLDVIWQMAMEVCTNALLLEHAEQVVHYLVSYMWWQTYQNQSFETLFQFLTEGMQF